MDTGCAPPPTIIPPMNSENNCYPANVPPGDPDKPGLPYEFNWTASDSQFSDLLASVQNAVEKGILPARISKGSSGSYLVCDQTRRPVGIFKPKNEEPYGQLNPKWTKWLHKTCCPCFFGRSCLMTNVGYISEVAASVVDRFLGLNIVPRTEIVELSASSFAYPIWDWIGAYRSRPTRSSRLRFAPKIGSFQLFVKNFDNAADVLSIVERLVPLPTQLERIFQLELERLVILDYVIRNTDRTLDNLLIHLSWEDRTTGRAGTLDQLRGALDSTESLSDSNFAESNMTDCIYHIKFAGIDNGLAFPYKHPDNWRSYPYGWAALPQASIPFSSTTRDRFLPILRDVSKWDELMHALQQIFRRDINYNDKHFRRQMSVLRGQLHNLKEALEQFQSPSDLIKKPLLVIEDEQEYLAAKKKNRSLDAELDQDYSSQSIHRWRRAANKTPCFSFC